MNRNQIRKSCMAAVMVLTMLFMPTETMKVQAAEVTATVEGTVLSGTSTDMLLLSTKDGKMEIKLDSDTDVSACKVLLPDTRITVSLSHGSDGYMHAVKVTNGGQQTVATVDTSSAATVIGTIGEKSSGSLLYFKTAQGEMEIKLDPTTDMSGCKVLVADRTYSIVCSRGNDAYMHALKITDGAVTGVSVGMTPAPAAVVTANLSTVTGTVGKKTKEDLLYLSTKGGEMEIVIDANTDARNGMMIVPGRELTVTVYRGDDAYMHAASLTGVKNSVQAAQIGSDTSAVTGTVGEKSTENVLYLNTPQGEMELKLDSVRNVNNCKIMVSGKKLSVTCARGDDAYMHAVDITGV